MSHFLILLLAEKVQRISEVTEMFQEDRRDERERERGREGRREGEKIFLYKRERIFYFLER